MMNRRNFGKLSGVIVDVCSKHGIWFDLGELPRVMAFVRDGGLLRAQQREAQQAAEDAARRRLSAASVPMGSMSSAPWARPELGNPEVAAQVLHDLGSAATELLDFVRTSLRRLK